MVPSEDCSDTESDLSHSSDGAAVQSISNATYVFPAWDPRHPSWSTPPSFKYEDVSHDVEILLDLDMIHNTTPDAEALQSSARLLSFLTYMPMISPTDVHDTSQILAAFSLLVSPEILGRLFEHRKLFRQAARTHRGSSTQASTTFVTWVDEFIVKICALTPVLAFGSIHTPPSTASENIQAQKHADALRAACQLPEEWHDLKNVIGSPHSSPAAKRSALSLMFAAYVMAPRLTSEDIRTSPPVDILDDLFDAARHMSSSVQSAAFDILHERVAAAMLISILSVVDKIDGSIQSALRPLQLRPEGLGYFLDLVWMVMGKDAGSFLPLEELDVAHLILLRWGNAVPWSWSTWNDQRNADTEYLRSVTSTWFYHLNRPLFLALDRSDDDRLFSVSLRQCLFLDVAASSCVVLQQLHYVLARFQQTENTRSSHSALLPGLLSKLCWATVQYLEDNAVEVHPSIQSRVPEFTKCFLLIFCHLGPSEEELVVQDLILEALCLVHVDTMSSCLQNVIQNKTHQFVRKLDQVTRKSARCLSSLQLDTSNPKTSSASLADEEDIKELGREMHAAKCLLEFLTIISTQKTQHDDAIHDIVLFYVDVLIGMLKSSKSDTCGPNLLLAPLLTTACIVRNSTTNPIAGFKDEDIWDLSIHLGDRTLQTAAVFAHFILASDEVCEPLMCLEAWDFLSSTLPAIAERNISEDEESLALLACATICLALRKLFCSCSRYIMSSPWTISMGITILAAVDGIHTSPYFKDLSTKLADVGRDLIKVTTMEWKDFVADSQTWGDMVDAP